MLIYMLTFEENQENTKFCNIYMALLILCEQSLEYFNLLLQTSLQTSITEAWLFWGKIKKY